MKQTRSCIHRAAVSRRAVCLHARPVPQRSLWTNSLRAGAHTRRAVGAWAVRPVTAKEAASAGALTTSIAVCSLLALGVEGALCIAMALPLAIPLGALGGLLAWEAGSSRLAAGGVTMLLLLPPASVTWDMKARPPVFVVRTAIEIAATPAQVWKHVVTFSELPEPHEWYFRAGLAYPQRARIVGSGVGAIRYCEFSTGPFVEPIEVWSEPRLLRFRVTSNPAPMREWSPYGNLTPKHLHGYLVSERSQFQLTPLANGHTLLGEPPGISTAFGPPNTGAGGRTRSFIASICGC